MPKTIESKFIIRGEDQGFEKIERDASRVHTALDGAGDSSLYDKDKAEAIRQQRVEMERLASATASYVREGQKVGGLGRGAERRPLPAGYAYKTSEAGKRPLPPGVGYKTIQGGAPPAPPPSGGKGPGGGRWVTSKDGRKFYKPPETGYIDLEEWERGHEPSEQEKLTQQKFQDRQSRQEEKIRNQAARQERAQELLKKRAEQQALRRAQTVARVPSGVVGAIGGGAPGIAGGLSSLGGLLMGLGPGGVIAGAIATAIASGAMIAQRVAQPALNIQNLQQPLRIRMGGARVQAAREFGTRYGYTPQESLQTLTAMEQTGSQAGFEAMARLRLGAGIEPEMAAKLAGGITTAGGVRPGDVAGYERFAKLIAVAISDRTKLPSVPQYLEQLNSLMSLSNNYLADLGESGTETVAAIAAWQETSNTSLLRGQRGAQTMASVAGWVAGTQDPAAQAMIYSALKNNPEFQAAAAAKFREQVATGQAFAPQSEYMAFSRYKNMPQAWLPALSGVTKKFGEANSDIGTQVLWRSIGGGGNNLTADQAAVLFKLGVDYKDDAEKIGAGFKSQTGKDLEQLLKPEDEKDMRRRQAEIAESQLKAGEATAGDVMAMNKAVQALLVSLVPFMRDATMALTAIANVVTFGRRDPVKEEEAFAKKWPELYAEALKHNSKGN